MTFVLAVLDQPKHQVTIVNAGHMAPLLRHTSGQVEDIGEEEAGFPLGIDAEFEYRQSCRVLASGESLTMFTDGISEAMNAEGELYGIERLRRATDPRQGPSVRAWAVECWTTCGVSWVAGRRTTTCAWFRSAAYNAPQPAKIDGGLAPEEPTRWLALLKAVTARCLSPVLILGGRTPRQRERRSGREGKSTERPDPATWWLNRSLGASPPPTSRQRNRGRSMTTRNTLGGIIHTYQKFDPRNFPSPTAEPPDLVSPAFEHMLAYGSMRELTDEELARAVHLDPSQIAGLGPSIDMLRALLEERRRKILETYETEPREKGGRRRLSRLVRHRPSARSIVRAVSPGGQGRAAPRAGTAVVSGRRRPRRVCQAVDAAGGPAGREISDRRIGVEV